MAVEVLQAADQYMLEGLKRLCEQAIGNSLTTHSLEGMWELSEQFNAPALGHQCVIFALQNYEVITAERGGIAASFQVRFICPRLLALRPGRASCVRQLHLYKWSSCMSMTGLGGNQ